MSAITQPHVGPWVLEDLADLPNNGNRYEIVEGNLYVSPPPVNRHTWVAMRLAVLLDEAAPPGLAALASGAGVHLGLSTFVPDVVVVREEAAVGEAAVFAAGDVLMVVEVESPSSVLHDRVTKPAVYARAGVPWYWRVELGGVPAVAVSRLDRGHYFEVSRASGGQPLEIDEPFPVRLVVADLLERR